MAPIAVRYYRNRLTGQRATVTRTRTRWQVWQGGDRIGSYRSRRKANAAALQAICRL